MDWNIIGLLTVLLSGLILQVESVSIIAFNVSSPVENATSSVILDCNFMFDPTEENLVMKWFFNDNPRPIYQWIVALPRPSYSDEIKRHIDPDFMVNDSFTKYRAIRLIKPTTKLTGTYKCTVSSIQSSDSASAKLIVYAPARSFSFTPYNDSSVLCKATGLYPSPSLELYRYIERNSSKVKVTKEAYTVITGEMGQYSIESSAPVEDEYLSQDLVTHYECILSIPDTDYILNKTLAFQRGWNTKTIGKSGSRSFMPCNNLIILSVIILSTCLNQPFLGLMDSLLL